ncbi:sigma-54-dependent transcriptional regulator [Aquimarina agarilytica]|uniref:sigma-54-dependent transcriptional regulator n=1 Tax=Aquimarina agarilytica TaxID=1087449 RepID=UPI000287F705|nr:sigma-54 dependent transcriptional regulator [Aquimarina agarilytica]
MKSKHILIVEDDISFSNLLETFLTKKGFQVHIAASFEQAKKELLQHKIDLVLSDMRLPDSNDLEIIPAVKKESNASIVMMTSYAEINLAVNAIKLGAIDYLEKPIQPTVLLSVIEKALNTKTTPTTAKQNSPAKESTATTLPSKFIKGTSPASKKLHEYIELVAPTPMSVLIIGESGTGKENIAKTIHDLSSRSNKPFVPVDCGAIPKEIASSEFFGHIKGSFTGALSDKKGHFSTANGGTLFLDEIGNLSYELQVQLLRAIQERKIRPIGSQTEINVDIRIIAATNSDLTKEAEKGNFREDLLHRLNEFSILVPSLKDRHEDLSLFANSFIEKSNIDLGKNCIGLDDETHEALKKYNWPGNLRELQNVIKRAVLLSTNNQPIHVNTLPEHIKSFKTTTETLPPLQSSENETVLIERALKLTNGNKAKAAKLLKIDRKTLYNKLKRYNINLN